MNMLSGIYFPDEGEIYVDGKEVTIRSPKDSFALGIGTVSYTHLDVYKRQAFSRGRGSQRSVNGYGFWQHLSCWPHRSSDRCRYVSYTHLSHLYCSYAGLFRNVYKTGRNYRNGGTVPVSYTHLDVYKRQVYTVLPLFYFAFVSAAIACTLLSVQILSWANKERKDYLTLDYICLLYTSRCV